MTIIEILLFLVKPKIRKHTDLVSDNHLTVEGGPTLKYRKGRQNSPDGYNNSLVV